ncbi:MAG TPA: hypothetical protein VMF69_06755 [Gemmataceae bacterium]|nr:hypothetical protein [Gemmataceae bacterium]
MSSEFRVVMSGPLADPFNLLLDIRDVLASRLSFDSMADAFIETEVEADDVNREGLRLPFQPPSRALAAGCTSASSGFTGSGIILDVFIEIPRKQFVNVSVEISDRGLVDAFRNKTLTTYYSALALIATSCRAVGAAGDLDFYPDPIAPEAIVATIINNPWNHGYPTDVGIIPSSVMPQQAVTEFAGDAFRVEKRLSYWLLVGHDFERLLREWP